VRHRRPGAVPAGPAPLVAGRVVTTLFVTGVLVLGLSVTGLSVTGWPGTGSLMTGWPGAGWSRTGSPAARAATPASLVAAHRPTTTTTHPAPGTQYDLQASQTFLLPTAPANWNPHAATNADPDLSGALTTVLGSVLPSVFTVTPGYQVVLNSTFVSSARQVRASPQTIRYRINPLATWSDGTPITYRDFVYAWQSQSGATGPTDIGGRPFTPASTDGYDDVASVTEVAGDPDTVSVVFSTPDPDWRSLFSLLLPAHVADTVGFDSGFTDPTTVVSGGPFEVQSSVPGISVTLVRNPRWWGAQANLAQVQFRFEADPLRVLPAFQQGQVEAGEVRPTTGLTRGLEKVSGMKTAVVAGPVWDHLDFNRDNPLLAAPALRQAIMLAIDRSQLIAATVGRSDPTVKPLDNLLFASNQPGYRNDAGEFGRGDVAAARAALSSAGYVYRRGILTLSGQPVTLGITTDAGDTLHHDVAAHIVTSLARIGITVTETDSPDLAATLQSGDFDLAVVTSTASPFLSQGAQRYQTDDHIGQGAADLDDISDPTIDAQAAQAAATPVGRARTAAYQRLDRTLWADAVSLPLFQEPNLVAWDRRYLNVGPNAAPGGATWNIAQWGIRAAS
jgi:peptide/nickel transport system substrate-binding protein